MSDQQPSERELIERARAGDASAFDALVGRYGALVLSVARSVTRHGPDAEDVAQEAFLRVYRSLDRLDPERGLEAWLVRVTLNTARSHVSRRPGRRESALEEAAHPRSSGQEAHRAMEAAGLREALMEAAACLGAREREVFMLRDLQGLEVATIAAALEIAPVTVRRLSSNARRKICAWVREHRPELAPGVGSPEADSTD